MPWLLITWVKIDSLAKKKGQFPELELVEWDSQYASGSTRANIRQCAKTLEELPAEARTVVGDIWWRPGKHIHVQSRALKLMLLLSSQQKLLALRRMETHPHLPPLALRVL